MLPACAAPVLQNICWQEFLTCSTLQFIHGWHCRCLKSLSKQEVGLEAELHPCLTCFCTASKESTKLGNLNLPTKIIFIWQLVTPTAIAYSKQVRVPLNFPNAFFDLRCCHLPLIKCTASGFLSPTLHIKNYEKIIKMQIFSFANGWFSSDFKRFWRCKVINCLKVTDWSTLRIYR